MTLDTEKKIFLAKLSRESAKASKNVSFIDNGDIIVPIITASIANISNLIISILRLSKKAGPKTFAKIEKEVEKLILVEDLLLQIYKKIEFLLDSGNLRKKLKLLNSDSYKKSNDLESVLGLKDVLF